MVGERFAGITKRNRKYPKAPGSQQWTPPGVDLDHATKGRPVAFENRQMIGSLMVKTAGGMKPKKVVCTSENRVASGAARRVMMTRAGEDKSRWQRAEEAGAGFESLPDLLKSKRGSWFRCF
jgi:hypothetical protein